MLSAGSISPRRPGATPRPDAEAAAEALAPGLTARETPATPDAEGEDKDIDELSQHPETGHGEEGDADTPADPLEDLDTEAKDRFAAKVRKAEMMADRTPDHAESLEAEAAEIVGADDLDELDADAIARVVDLHG